MKSLVEIPELFIQYEIIKTIITGDISTIVKLGTNASQAVAQVVKQNEITTCALSGGDSQNFMSTDITTHRVSPCKAWLAQQI